MIPAAEAPVVAVGVALREWRVTVYRPAVRPGRIKLVLRNLGEDDHDLRVLGPRGYRSAVSPEIKPGESGVLRVRLRRQGRYRLICTLKGHAKLGMQATLRVRRPSSKRSKKRSRSRSARSGSRSR